MQKVMWLHGEIARKVPNTHRLVHSIADKGIGRSVRKNGKTSDLIAAQAGERVYSVMV